MPEENTIIPESLRNAIGVESDPITYEIEKGHIASCLLYTSPSPRD